MSADEERRLTREHLLAVSLGKTTKSHGNENHRTISVVVGTDGAIYVSNRGTSIGIGEVLKIQP